MYNWKALSILGLLMGSQGVVQAKVRLTVKTPLVTPQEVRCHHFKARLYALATRSHEEDKKASARIAHLLRECKDPQFLSAAALWSIQRIESHGCDGQCHICNRYEEIFDGSLFALADLHTPESARNLVNVLTTKSSRWDGHLAETIAFAVTKAGKSTLPFLQRSHDKSYLVKMITTAVEAGKILQ